MDLLGLFDSASLPILIVAILAACNCALVGSYLVLRRMSLLGDAISHGVLPGLVIGFLLAGSRDLLPMLLGALVAALGTALATDFLKRKLRIDGDAAMGVVFTTLFALGVILIERYAGQVDLDPGCVLYGQVEYASIDRWSFAIFGWRPPRAAVSLFIVFAFDIAVIALLWKEFLITSFDAPLADSLGLRSTPMHLLLMGMTALTTVASFEAVGSILVVAMLVIPAAIGTLLSDRLIGVILCAQGAAVATAVGGLMSAEALDTSVAGMMAVSARGLFACAFILAPRHGWLPRRLRRLQLSVRIVEEDLLGVLYRKIEKAEGTDEPATESGAPPWHPSWLQLLARLRLRLTGAVTSQGGEAALTERGRARGQRLVRRHRLWEIYLSDRLAIPASHLHDPAHRIEHFLDEELTRRIEEKLDSPDRDPHGREIPAVPDGGRKRNTPPE